MTIAREATSEMGEEARPQDRAARQPGPAPAIALMAVPVGLGRARLLAPDPRDIGRAVAGPHPSF